MDNLRQPSAASILYRERYVTDKPLLSFFVVYLLFWISIGIYAYAAGDSTNIFPPTNRSNEYFNVERIFVIISYILVGGVFTAALYAMMRWTKSAAIYVFTVFWIPLVIFVVAAVLSGKAFLYYVVIGAALSWMVTYVMIGTEWIYLPEQILKEVCITITFFPSATVFMIICNIMSMLVTLFAVTVHLHLVTITQVDSGALPWYIKCFLVVNITSAIWLLLFIFNFGQMVFSGAVASWYWAKDKDRLIDEMIWCCIQFTIRYHLGTIAFGTSIFGVIRALEIIVKHVIERFRHGIVNTTFLFFILYNIFDMIVLRFIITGSLVTCAMNGKAFYHSAKESFSYMAKYSSRSYLMTKVLENAILFFTVILSFTMMFAVGVYLTNRLPPYDKNDYNWNLMFMTAIIAGCLIFFVLPLLCMLISGFNTILICFFLDIEMNDGSQQKPYYMSPELQRILRANAGPPGWYRSLMAWNKMMHRMNP